MGLCGAFSVVNRHARLPAAASDRSTSQASQASTAYSKLWTMFRKWAIDPVVLDGLCFAVLSIVLSAVYKFPFLW